MNRELFNRAFNAPFETVADDARLMAEQRKLEEKAGFPIFVEILDSEKDSIDELIRKVKKNNEIYRRQQNEDYRDNDPESV